VTQVPLALALAAGMLAAVNPCGFALLPAYLSLLVIGDDSPGRLEAVRRALASSAAMTAGFVAVFAAFGVLVTPLAGSLQQHLPWFTIVLGLLLAGVGGWLLTGRDLPGLRLQPGRRPAVTRSVPSMAGFGVAYALASLGCTVAPFLAVVGSSLRTDSTLAGLALFVAYAAGMGLTVGTAALAVALARTSVLARMRRVGPAVSRASGALLLIAGGYVAYYGWYEIRLLRGRGVDDPIIDAAAAGQRGISGALDRLGAPALAAIFAVLLVASVAAAVRARRRATRTTRTMGTR